MKNEAPAALDAARLMELLRQQRDSYRDLGRLAERQRRLIAEDDPGELLSLLGRRQKLTQELVEMGRQLAPHRENWAATRDALDPRDRQLAEHMLAEVRELLGKIIEGDEQDARSLSARKTHTAAELGTTRAERQAIAAYAATAGPPAGRLDRISEES